MRASCVFSDSKAAGGRGGLERDLRFGLREGTGDFVLIFLLAILGVFLTTVRCSFPKERYGALAVCLRRCLRWCVLGLCIPSRSAHCCCSPREHQFRRFGLRWMEKDRSSVERGGWGGSGDGGRYVDPTKLCFKLRRAGESARVWLCCASSCLNGVAELSWVDFDLIFRVLCFPGTR